MTKGTESPTMLVVLRERTVAQLMALRVLPNETLDDVAERVARASLSDGLGSSIKSTEATAERPETAKYTDEAEPTGKRPWRDEKKGATLFHGEKLEMSYNGETYYAEIVDGRWRTEDGELHDCPSRAARHVARTKADQKTHLNGWVYWKVWRNGRLIGIDSVRKLDPKRKPPPPPFSIHDL